jgi:primosomal protein N'
MVEHRLMHRLACHHCGHVMPPPKSCPDCGTEDSLVPCGPGVERLEEEAASLFPGRRILVLSSDVIETVERLRQELDEARAHKQAAVDAEAYEEAGRLKTRIEQLEARLRQYESASRPVRR